MDSEDIVATTTWEIHEKGTKVWTYFLRSSTKKDGKSNRFLAKCNFCHKVLDGKAYKMLQHLVQSCPEIDPEQKSEAISLQEALAAASKDASSVATPSKRQRLSRMSIPNATNYSLLKKYWNNQVHIFDDCKTPISKGRVRTIHENYLILMSLKMVLKGYLRGMKDLNELETINWPMLEREVSHELHVSLDNVTQLRQEFFHNRTMVGCENVDSNKKGQNQPMIDDDDADDSDREEDPL
jgi:BED zinc finger